MSDLSFNIKKGDTHKPISMHLRYTTSSGYSDVDLTGATAKFYMRKRGERVNKIDGSACTITSATTGRLRYTFASGNVDTIGTYEAEVVVTFSGSEETFPEDNDKIVVVVHEAMD